MKKISYFASLAAMMLLGSCTSDTEDFVAESNSGNTVTIGVSMSEADGTRVNTDNIRGLLWDANDRLKVYGFTDNGQTYKGCKIYNIDATTAGSATAKFTGKEIAGADIFQIFCLGKNYNYDLEYQMDECDYTTQVQNGVNNSAHIKDYLRLESVPVTSLSSVKMRPYTSILKLNIKSLPKEIKDAASLDISYYVNYGDAAEHKNAGVKLNGAITAGSDNFVYMAFDHKDADILQKGKNICIELVAKNARCKAYATSAEGKAYAAGKIYSATLDYDNKSSWTWDIISADAMKQIYKDTFNSQDTINLWTTEGNTQNISFISLNKSEDSTSMLFNIDAFTYDGSDLYVVSPMITLGKNANTVSITHKYDGFQSVNVSDCLFLKVRKEGTTEWLDIPLGKMPKNFTNTGDLEVPTSLAGAKVQFAFRNLVKGFAFFHMWYIKDFEVKGM